MRRGFSLVELIVVIGIILILIAIILPVAHHRITDAKLSRLASELRTLRRAVIMYYSDTGRLPDTLDNLFMRTSAIPTGWRGPYIDRRPFEYPAGSYAIYTPFGTYIWLSRRWTPGTWDGVRYEEYVYLIISKYDGHNEKLTPALCERLDELIDDGALNSGSLVEDTWNLYYLLVGL